MASEPICNNPAVTETPRSPNTANSDADICVGGFTRRWGNRGIPNSVCSECFFDVCHSRSDWVMEVGRSHCLMTITTSMATLLSHWSGVVYERGSTEPVSFLVFFLPEFEWAPKHGDISSPAPLEPMPSVISSIKANPSARIHLSLK